MKALRHRAFALNLFLTNYWEFKNNYNRNIRPATTYCYKRTKQIVKQPSDNFTCIILLKTFAF